MTPIKSLDHEAIAHLGDCPDRSLNQVEVQTILAVLQRTEADLKRYKDAWPDPDAYAAALRREQGNWDDGSDPLA